MGGNERTASVVRVSGGPVPSTASQTWEDSMSDHWEKEARDVVNTWLERTRHLSGPLDVSSAGTWIEEILVELLFKNRRG